MHETLIGAEKQNKLQEQWHLNHINVKSCSDLYHKNLSSTTASTSDHTEGTKETKPNVTHNVWKIALLFKVFKASFILGVSFR